MTTSTLAAILFQLLLQAHTYPAPADRPEDESERVERLYGIAEDAAAVAHEVSPGDEVSSALLLLAVAQHESGFAVDTDLGPCRGDTCDHGHAFCMLQIHGPEAEREEYFADRRKCFTVGLRYLLHGQAKDCPGEELRFAGYAGGTCDRGAQGSRELYAYWRTWSANFHRWAPGPHLAPAKASEFAICEAADAPACEVSRVEVLLARFRSIL